ncbi:MAG: HU family DNA-binding protein [Desulfovibrio sp.]|nr:HU family DNA-binding protein [Desulfovibrio sp.]
MTKAELVKTLKEQARLATNAQAEAAYNGLFNILAETLKKGDSVAIPGFGSFKVVERKARKGRNPRSGEEIAIPASKAVKFTPGKTLKACL